MLSPYIGLIVLFVVSAGFLAGVLILASWLGPKNRTPTKQLPFECGSVSVGDPAGRRLDVHFYLMGVLFLLFDVEVVLLYPWAVSLRDLGWPGFVEMLLFVLVVAVGLVYVWRRGVLDWNQ